MLPNFYFKTSFSLLKYSLLLALFFIINEAYSQVVNNSGSSNKKQATVENLIQTFSTNEAVKIFCFPDSVLKLSLSQPIDSIITLDKFKEILRASELVSIKIQPSLYVILPKKDIDKILKKAQISSQEYSDIQIIGADNKVSKQKKAELTGIITDGKTGEPIIGATVMIKNSVYGSATDLNGGYAFSIAPGIYTLVVSSVGFEDKSLPIKLLGNGLLNVELFDKSIKLEEVIVSALKADRNVRNNQMSIVELDKKAIKQIPSMFGEKDVVKSLTTMPGVKSVGEFGSGINVRGGSSDQNLFLLEGTPIFNTSHVFGLISVVNPDIVNSVTLYKGHIPASYGERVSSVLDIQLKEGSYSNFHLNGGLGILNSRLTIETPIVKDKSSISISGRSSYSDWLLKQLPDIHLRNSSAKFYDFNFIGSAITNENNKVVIMGYASSDIFKYDTIMNYAYTSYMGSIVWNHKFSNEFNVATTLAFSQYNLTKDKLDSEFEKSQLYSQNNYFSIKSAFNYSLTNRHLLDFGIQSILYRFNPGEISPLDSLSNIVPEKLNMEQGLESTVFLNDKFDVSEKTSLQLGVRMSMYQYLGANSVMQYTEGFSKSKYTALQATNYSEWSIIKSYANIEPRASVKYITGETSSIKMSYNRNVQYVSLVSYTSLTSPDDVWKLSSPYILPVKCNQMALGYFRNFLSNEFETSIEVYYKKLTDLVEYKNGAKLSMNHTIETELMNAKGNNYGAELFLKKNGGTIDGWMSYTYSRSLRQTTSNYTEEQVNENAVYPSPFDKPHDFSLMATYHQNKRLSASLSFNYSTGRAITLPISTTTLANTEVVVFSDRNQYRLPDYHRLDLSITYDESLKTKKRWKGSWTLSVINLYARKNAYSVIYKKVEPTKDNGFKKYGLYKLYIIGKPLPTLTYNFIF